MQSYQGVKHKIANVPWFQIAADVPAFPNKVCKRTRVSKKELQTYQGFKRKIGKLTSFEPARVEPARTGSV